MSAAPSPETVMVPRELLSLLSSIAHRCARADASCASDYHSILRAVGEANGILSALHETHRDELAALLERSRQFICHDGDCQSEQWLFASPSKKLECTCGCSDLLARIQAALGG